MQLTQAILPVAGLGTRFLPWTKVVPKELLPIGNQPIIALLVDECLSVGIHDICFVISKGKEMIPQYFYEHPELEEILAKKGKTRLLTQLNKYDHVRIHVVYQEEQLGDGHAVLQAADWVESDVLAVLFGDDLIAGAQNGLQQMAAAYDALPADEQGTAAMLCLENVPRDMTSQYGIAAIDDTRSRGRLKRITGLVEKPAPRDAPSTLGVIGKYLVPRSTIDMLPTLKMSQDAAQHHAGGDGEIRLIDALIRQLDTVPMYGVEAEGTRLDTGRPEGYKEAVRLLG